jgi:hypothetical protein
MSPSRDDGIDEPPERDGARKRQHEADAPLGFQGYPQIDAADVMNRVRYAVASASTRHQRMPEEFPRTSALCGPGIRCRYTSASPKECSRAVMVAVRFS